MYKNETRYALINGVLLDGTRDMIPQTGKVVCVEGGKLAAVAEDRREVDLVALAQHGGEQLLLAVEVVQQARLAEPHRLGEVAHGCAAVAMAGDHVERGEQDLLALAHAFCV